MFGGSMFNRGGAHWCTRGEQSWGVYNHSSSSVRLKHSCALKHVCKYIGTSSLTKVFDDDNFALAELF